MSASERPWKAVEVPTQCGRCFVIGNDEMIERRKEHPRKTATTICVYDDYGHGKNQNEANAALIVKAVNYHDRLKTALQVLLTKSEQHIFGDECLKERSEARALLSEIEASK